jgi:hypothetical protein
MRVRQLEKFALLKRRAMHIAVVLVVYTLSQLGVAQIAPYAGAMGGLATLSGDAGSERAGGALSLSSYSPQNGGALDVFAGAHIHEYFSVEGDFIWNRNRLQLNSSSSDGSFYQEDRTSSQRAVIFSFLIYFRPRHSRIRPYLGTGVGVAHLSSTRDSLLAVGGMPDLPPERFSSTKPVLRSHVGIDFKLTRKLDFRYSFSETIGSNEISRNLSPHATRSLKNFQNLFGFVVRF